ncbi:retrovirus-related pol polyprotein from transposon TNT 1-94 [Tanacetum coccineum]
MFQSGSKSLADLYNSSFIVDSGCTKHMTGNLKLLCNFVEKFLGTVRFGNDQFAPILGYGDLIQGNVTIKQIFRETILLTGNRGSDLYTISLQETTSSTPICFMAKASPTQAWLWHRRLSHLNFDYITLLSKKDIVTGLPKLTYVKDQLCSSCEMSKAKRSSFKSKVVPSSKGRLQICFTWDLYTWTLFLRSKDETPEVLKDFLTMIQRNLQAQVITVRTDRGTEFLNKTLHAYFKEEGIEHQTSTPRTPEQNGVVERRNRTLVEAARTMLSASKLPLSTHGKTAYHIINDRKPSIKHLHIFGCIFESIHIKFDEIKEMMSDHNSSDLAPQRQEMSVENVSSGLVPQGQKASDYDNSDPVPQRQMLFLQQNRQIRTTRVRFLFRTSCGILTMPVQTRRQLATDPEMCMFALTVVLLNEEHKEAMADSAWTKQLQDELHQVYVAQQKGGSLIQYPAPSLPSEESFVWIKQAPRAWYDELSNFLMSKGFTKGLQIHQSPKGIFINQAKYALEILKKHNMDNCHSIGTPLATKPKLDVDLSREPVDNLIIIARQHKRHSRRFKSIFTTKVYINMGLWYPKDSGFETTAFSDVIMPDAWILRKSTYEGISSLVIS